MKNRGLGKGLSALISEQHSATTGDEITKISLDNIQTSAYQPRRIFDEEAINELAESIRRHGIIQPIILRSATAGQKHEIVAGERRWRAAKVAGLQQVPAIIKQLTDDEMAEQALIENIQRQELNPVEEAEAYIQLINKYNYSQESLAQALGKKRSHVANMVRLTILPSAVTQKILKNELSFSHAKLLVGHDDAEEIAEAVIDKGLSVRQTEKLLKSWHRRTSPYKGKILKRERKIGDSEFAELAENLTAKLGVKVDISSSSNGGKVVIHYTNFEQLDSIIEKLSALKAGK